MFDTQRTAISARSVGTMLVACLMLAIQLILIVRLQQLGSVTLTTLASFALLGQLSITIVMVLNCYRRKRSLIEQLHSMQANAQLLEELQSQRDTLARAMAERAKSDVRLKLLESAVVHARDAIIILEAEPSGDVGRSVLYVNSAFTQITGYTPEEVIGRSLHFLRGPASDHDTLEKIRDALNSNRSLQTELLNYRKDGSEVWVELNLVPVYDANNGNSVAHWVMIQRDASSRKMAERALRLSEERLRAIYYNTNTGVAVGRPTGELIEVNPAFCRMVGYTAHELLKLRVQDITHPEDLHQQRAALNDVLNHHVTSYHLQKRYLHKDGHTVWADLHCHVTQNVAGEPISIIAVVLDITQRKRAQEALRRSEERYRLLFDHNPLPMWVLDRGTLKFLAVNEAALQKYGYSREEFLERTLVDLTDLQDREQYRKRLQRGTSLDLNTRIWPHRTKSGQLLHVEMTANDLPSQTLAASTTLMLVNDVTDKQRLEEQLRQSQKMEAIGQLAGGIAHDFNNLLTAIIGNLAVINLPPDNPNRRLVQTAERAANRAAELTRKLLGFARRNQLLLASVSIQDVLLEVVDLLKRTFDPRIELVTEIEVNELILADATLINQALLNLCINSRDAMPHGGRLVIRADLVDVSPEAARNHPEAKAGHYVRLSVQDTGTGMLPEILQRVFEPFFTTKPVGQGTGLGLPMVHGILRQHNGWVACESVVNQGTRFDLYLPRIPTRPGQGSTVVRRSLTQRELPMDAVSMTPRPIGPSHATPQLLAPSCHTTRTILLVDDEDMIREIARMTLEAAGYEVLQAADGQEAVDIFREKFATIDLVLLDLTMPRLSGRDAFQQMRDIDPDARVMFASGFSNDDLSDINGSLGLLPKPYRPADLLQAVRGVLPTPTHSAVSVQ